MSHDQYTRTTPPAESCGGRRNRGSWVPPPVAFNTPRDAVEFCRAALGIQGQATAEDARRLAELFAYRLEVEESPICHGFIAYWPDGSATLWAPDPRQYGTQRWLEAFLHELGHFLLTWPARDDWELVYRYCERDPRAIWRWGFRLARRERRANEFVNLWLSYGRDNGGLA